MKPIDFRNTTWTRIRQELSGRRAQVYNAWRLHGPGTTRELAQDSGIDVLNVRPRTTELCELGLVKIVDGANGEGIYRATTEIEWNEAHGKTTLEQASLL